MKTEAMPVFFYSRCRLGVVPLLFGHGANPGVQIPIQHRRDSIAGLYFVGTSACTVGELRVVLIGYPIEQISADSADTGLTRRHFGEGTFR